MVGRGVVMQRVLRNVSQRSVTIVTGPAGIGKTRFLVAAEQRIITNGGRTLWVRGREALQDIPLAAFGLVPDLEAGPDPQSVLHHVWAWARSNREHAAVVIVDDAHWLDATSLRLVRQLLHLEELVVVMAARDHVPLIAELSTAGDRAVRRVGLPPLTPEEGLRVATDLAGSRLAPTVLKRLNRRAGGNPLFIRELVADLIETADGGSGGAESAGVGRSAAMTIRGRFGRLDDAGRAHFERICVAGRISLSVIESFGDVQALSDLDDRGLINVTVSGRRHEVEPAHPFFTEVLRATTSEIVWRRRARELLAAIEANPSRRHDDGAMSACLRYIAGLSVNSDAATAAATALVSRGPSPLATRLAADAFSNAPSLERARLLAHCLLQEGRPAEASAVFERSDALVVSGDDAVALASDRMIFALHGLRDVAAADAALVEPVHPLNDAQRCALDALGAGPALYRGRLDQCIAKYHAASGPAANPAAVLWTALPAAIALYLRGQPRRSLEVLDRLGPDLDAWTRTFPTAALTIDAERAVALAWQGDQLGASKILTAAHATAHADFDLGTTQHVSILFPLVSWFAGNVREPASRLLQIDPAALGTYAMWVPYAAHHLAATAYRLGDVSVGNSLSAFAATTACASMDLCAPTALRAASERLFRSGDQAAAERNLRDGYEIATSHGNTCESLLISLRLAAVHRSPSVLTAAVQHAAELDSPLGRRIGDGLQNRHDPDRRQAAINDLVVRGHHVVARDLHDAVSTARPDTHTAGARTVPHSANRSTLTHRTQLASLTAREREVVSRIAAGLSDAAVAAELSISVRTVHAHMRSIFSKLDIKSRSTLLDMAKEIPTGP